MTEHVARKRFGQHFLQSEGIIERIVEAVDPRPGQRLVEIGPGLGALTIPLIARVGQLIAVELDRDIVARLRERFSADVLDLRCADALSFDFSALGGGLRLVGNLPYNISTPLLFHLTQHSANIVDLHVMLQREVVERMVAGPGSKVYGRLSVMLQYRFAMQRLFVVPPGAFSPPPKVDSAVVRLLPHFPLPHPAVSESVLARVVTQAFGQRRKTLRNSLAGLLSAESISRSDVDPAMRAENLPVEAFVRLADAATVANAAG